MPLWGWVLISCAVAFLTKLAGYLVPAKVLKNKRVTRVAGTITIGLLASLTVVNAVATGTQVILDSRIGALGAAAIALLLRAPFLVVVIAGAVAAALLRLIGLP